MVFIFLPLGLPFQLSVMRTCKLGEHIWLSCTLFMLLNPRFCTGNFRFCTGISDASSRKMISSRAQAINYSDRGHFSHYFHFKGTIRCIISSAYIIIKVRMFKWIQELYIQNVGFYFSHWNYEFCRYQWKEMLLFGILKVFLCYFMFDCYRFELYAFETYKFFTKE